MRVKVRDGLLSSMTVRLPDLPVSLCHPRRPRHSPVLSNVKDIIQQNNQNIVLIYR